jgi:hypothetical protein
VAESVSKPHLLIITELEARDPETHIPYREWEVVHPDDCPKFEEEDPLIPGTKTEAYDCMVAHEVYHVGLDGLYPDWTTLAAGEFQIEAFSNYDPYSMEWDGGLRLLEDEE